MGWLSDLFGADSGSMGPSANRYGGMTAAQQPGFLTGALNELGSGQTISNIGDALTGLSYTIGSFAKNPQTRAMYINAAQAWHAHKQRAKDETFNQLVGLAPNMMKLFEQAAGNPAAIEHLKSMAQTYGANLKQAALRAGHSEEDANAYLQEINSLADVYSSMPAPAQEGIKLSPGENYYNADGTLRIQGPDANKPLTELAQLDADLKAGRISQADHDAAVYKVTHFAPATQVNVPGLEMGYDSQGRPVVGPGASKLNEDQRKSAGLYYEAVSDLPVAEKYFDALGNTEQQLKAGIPVVGNFLTSPEYQQGHDAIMNIGANVLYGKSGAQLTESEVKRVTDLYIPQPGDSEPRKEQKRARVRRAVEGLGIRAGITKPGETTDKMAPPQPTAAPAPVAAPANTPPDQQPGRRGLPPGAVILGQ